MLWLFVSVTDAHRVLNDFDQAGLAALQSRASRIDRSSFKQLSYTWERGKERAGWQAVSPLPPPPPCDLNILNFPINPHHSQEDLG